MTTVNYFSIERIDSGLFQTQVLHVLEDVAKNNNVTVQLCILVYPWHLFSLRKKIKELRLKCIKAKIKLRLKPLLFPIKFAMSSTFHFHFLGYYFAIVTQLFPKCDVWHCRGYITTGAVTRRRDQPTVIFDMRSLWIEEHLASGVFDKNEKLLRKWYQLEKKCISKSKYVVGVSKAMGEAKGISSSEKYRTIPIAVDTEKLKFSPSEGLRIRADLGWQDKKIIVYSGSFGLRGLNHNALVSCLRDLFAEPSDLRLLLLTDEPNDRINELISDAGIQAQHWKCFRVNADDMGKYLSAADVGLHALGLQPDAKTRLGTKVVEYWANSLPVLLTDTVGAAAEICRSDGVGLVMRTNTIDKKTYPSIPSLIPDRDAFFSNFSRFDISKFSSESVAGKYSELYFEDHKQRNH